MSEEDWNSPESRFLAYILAANDNTAEPLFIVFNAAENGVEFTLPPWANVAGWSRVLDTAANSVLADEKKESPGVQLIVSPASILVFAGKP
jgi:isoamylase